MKAGEKLRFLRKLKGFTQEEMALKLNIERRTYCNLENGCSKIDIDRIHQIAKIYGIEVDALINFDESTAFTNCFNNNDARFFSAEKIYATTSTEQQELFINHIQTLIATFNDERKAMMDIIASLKSTIDQTHK